MRIDWAFHIILGVLNLFLVTLALQRKGGVFVLVAPLAFGVAAVALALALAEDMFHVMGLLAGGLFIHGTCLALGLGLICWQGERRVGGFFVGIAGLLLLVAAWSSLVEPTWLEVTRYTLTTSRLEKPMKIVILSDIQADHVGAYEEKVLRLAMAEKPDLILLPGDYIHERDREKWKQQAALLNELFRRVNLSAPLGVYAVQGNVDPPGVENDVFAGLDVTYFDAPGRVVLEELVITGITLWESYQADFSVQPEEKFHIVLGHIPNFALGNVPADLLVAGHTHGGQVQLPFWGPVITLSLVPREWAAGTLVERFPGSFLVISRGIGMERGNAPRLRFLCRPELVVLEVVPKTD